MNLLTSVYMDKPRPFLTRGYGDRRRSKSFKLKEGIMKKFHTMEVVRHQSMLLREVVDFCSLKAFKARLDETFSNPAHDRVVGTR